jgi:hypothetical protein
MRPGPRSRGPGLAALPGTAGAQRAVSGPARATGLQGAPGPARARTRARMRVRADHYVDHPPCCPEQAGRVASCPPVPGSTRGTPARSGFATSGHGPGCSPLARRAPGHPTLARAVLALRARPPPGRLRQARVGAFAGWVSLRFCARVVCMNQVRRILILSLSMLAFVDPPVGLLPERLVAPGSDVHRS